MQPQSPVICPGVLFHGVLDGVGVRDGAVIHIGFEPGLKRKTSLSGTGEVTATVVL